MIRGTLPLLSFRLRLFLPQLKTLKVFPIVNYLKTLNYWKAQFGFSVLGVVIVVRIFFLEDFLREK